MSKQSCNDIVIVLDRIKIALLSHNWLKTDLSGLVMNDRSRYVHSIWKAVYVLFNIPTFQACLKQYSAVPLSPKQKALIF